MTVTSIFQPQHPGDGANGTAADRNRRRLLWAIWLGLLAGGIAMAVWASIDDHFPADVAVGRWMQANDIAGQSVLSFMRDIGSGIAAVATVLVMTAVLAVSGRRRVAAVSVAFILGLVVITLLKEVVDRPRTSVLFLEQRETFDSLSFPSGHVMGSLIVETLVLYVAVRVVRGWWLRAPLALWAIAVAAFEPWVSVATGVHWPSDVLGGLVWGSVVIIPGWYLLERARMADARAAPSGGG